MLYEFDNQGLFMQTINTNQTNYNHDKYTTIPVPSQANEGYVWVFDKDTQTWAIAENLKNKIVYNKVNGKEHYNTQYLQIDDGYTDIQPPNNLGIWRWSDSQNKWIPNYENEKIETPKKDDEVETLLTKTDEELIALGYTRAELQDRKNKNELSIYKTLIFNKMVDDKFLILHNLRYTYGLNAGHLLGNSPINNNDFSSPIPVENKKVYIEFRLKITNWQDKTYIITGATTDHQKDRCIHIGFRRENQFTVAFYTDDVNYQTNINLNEWHNYRVEIEGNISKFYLDEVLIGEHTHDGNLKGVIEKYGVSINGADRRGNFELRWLNIDIIDN